MITLASDFGSPYPAAMRGVMLAATDARLVDIAHDLPRQDVRAAAFWLREVLPWFPPAVHLAVVDPGVGTDRAAVVMRAGAHALVGPDNGLLVPPARALCDRQGLEPTAIEAFDIDPADPASSTFHGRDVFAPAAATVHEVGVGDIEDRFEPIKDVVDLRLPAPDLTAAGATGEVLVVDDFGNVVTNIPGDALGDAGDGTVSVNGQEVTVVRSYGHVPAGQPLVTVGSHGNVELAVTRGRGDEVFDLTPGDPVELRYLE